MSTGCCDRCCEVHRAEKHSEDTTRQCKYRLTPYYDAKGFIHMICPACVDVMLSTLLASRR